MCVGAVGEASEEDDEEKQGQQKVHELQDESSSLEKPNVPWQVLSLLASIDEFVKILSLL